MVAEQTVTVEEEVPIIEALDRETPVNLDADCANAVGYGENRVRVNLVSPGNWRAFEFDLEDTPWSVYTVESGQYAPAVTFEREQ